MKPSIYFNRMACAAIAMSLSLAMQAQTQDRKLCDFETSEACLSIGAYDTWESSPLRKGAMPANVRVVSNHLTAPDPARGFTPNPSKKILAMQRSRFGSNTFGALVGLREPFAQTKRKQYVHVKIYSPKAGPAMLIGLGNRDDRPSQSAMTEQFWSTASRPLVANQWNDAVFAVSGADGITIRNLLIVPDATSPHDLSADFAAYIDDIVLSVDPLPFFTTSAKAGAKTFAVGDRVALSRGVDDLGGGLNGDILLADGSPVTGKTAVCGKPLGVKVVPAPGFHFSKLVIRHGRDLDGEAGNNWTETTVGEAQFKNGSYTIPASVVDGDMRLVPYFSNAEK